uniref:Uncharacterized protein n=2 Tax=Anguilla anguilla TaxID=7936 RepID=A0A0E9V0M5_ANGAN
MQRQLKQCLPLHAVLHCCILNVTLSKRAQKTAYKKLAVHWLMSWKRGLFNSCHLISAILQK